jgi:hypothetical protein
VPRSNIIVTLVSHIVGKSASRAFPDCFLCRNEVAPTNLSNRARTWNLICETWQTKRARQNLDASLRVARIACWKSINRRDLCRETQHHLPSTVCVTHTWRSIKGLLRNYPASFRKISGMQFRGLPAETRQFRIATAFLAARDYYLCEGGPVLSVSVWLSDRWCTASRFVADINCGLHFVTSNVRAVMRNLLAALIFRNYLAIMETLRVPRSRRSRGPRLRGTF